MFNFNYFTSLHTKGFKTLSKVGEGTWGIRKIEYDVVRGNLVIILTDDDGKKHRFDMSTLNWFGDDGVMLILESQISFENGIAKSNRWFLSRQ